MKSREVLELLNITRPTLTKYVKEGLIRITVMPNGRYNYNDEDVRKIAYRGITRKTVIYSRVSTYKQKKDLENQTNLLKQFCFSRGYQIHQVVEEIASGISFDKRKAFLNLLDDIMEKQVERIVITYKDRISRVGFDLFYHLFKKYDTEIVVVSEVGSSKLDSEEVFEEIVSLLHCYSMKMYSSRKKKTVEDLIKPEE